MTVQGQTCLVTGGTGFIGSNLVRALGRGGWLVRVLSRGMTVCRELPAGVEMLQGDVADRSAVRRALQGVKTLFHFASTTNPATAHGHSDYDVETNLIAAIRLLEAAQTEGVQRVVFASSGGTVYGRVVHVPVAETHPTEPICSHGIVKLAVEKYLHLFQRQGGPDYTVLRYANPYGPGQSASGRQGAVAVLAGRILQGQPIEVFGDGSVVRDFIYIDDLVDATLRAAQSPGARNEILNIGSGVGVSIRTVVRKIEQASGLTAETRLLPARAFDVPVSTLDSTKAERILGWRASTNFDDGLPPTIAWLRTLPLPASAIR